MRHPTLSPVIYYIYTAAWMAIIWFSRRVANIWCRIAQPESTSLRPVSPSAIYLVKWAGWETSQTDPSLRTISECIHTYEQSMFVPTRLKRDVKGEEGSVFQNLDILPEEEMTSYLRRREGKKLREASLKWPIWRGLLGFRARCQRARWSKKNVRLSETKHHKVIWINC